MRCAMYRNNGDGTFTDVTRGSGLEEPGLYTKWISYCNLSAKGKRNVAFNNAERLVEGIR